LRVRNLQVRCVLDYYFMSYNDASGQSC
jgi:hypothetical protein